jgi:SNF2 family DNA or RNA helicase
VAQQFRDALAGRMFKHVLMLTATPIQNRLWDIYSLVDLLAVARGHQNPVGSEGIFARTYIADNRMEARHLNPQTREAFRSVVYGYMSRIRRADANLHFPERIVQLHRVDPSTEELQCPVSGSTRQANTALKVFKAWVQAERIEARP